MIVLGIESSCDETAAALVRDGSEILSSIVASQIDVHHRYGGVVPELASRLHVESIVPVVTEAISAANVSMDAIDAVAATRGPGLVGALLVGFSFAKAFAYARNLPWTGVNHLEGHIYSVLIHEPRPRFPFTILLASGGHTSIYQVTSQDDFRLLGQTRDDAAGEAFDKVAKMLGLGYPGGAVIERLAAGGDPDRFRFPRAFLEKDGFDFSFSGLKSAVLRVIQDRAGDVEEIKADIAAGFQAAVFDVLSFKLMSAAKAHGSSQVAVAGGVAANSALADRLRQDASDLGLDFYLPPRSLCGDNAAMIAARGYWMLSAGQRGAPEHDVFSRNRI